MIIQKQTALMIPLALALGQAQAATLCVDPANSPPCFATIQAAVNAAAAGDTIDIAVNPSSKGYTENVVIATANLTLIGKGKASGGPTSEKCPNVIVDACETGADPTDCGVNTFGGDAITVNAAGVTVQGLLIRHGDKGIGLNAGADNTTITSVCFIDNGEHVFSGGGVVNDVTVADSLFRGGSGGDAIDLDGDDIQIQRNIFFTTDNGVDITGDNFYISNNNFITSNDDCIDVRGDNGKIHDNVLKTCDDPIDYDGDQPDIRRNDITSAAGGQGVDLFCSDGSFDPATCTGGTIANNKINGVGDDTQGMDVDGDNLVIENNNIVSTADEGINYEGSHGIIRNNAVRRAGSENESPGIDIDGSDNLIEGNIVELNSYVGIRNYSGDDNTYRQNKVVNNGRSGILIKEGDDTIIDNNIVVRNHGEGVNNGSLATDTTIDNNTITDNRTDVCNDGSVLSFVGNTFGTGGIATACVVDQ